MIFFKSVLVLYIYLFTLTSSAQALVDIKDVFPLAGIKKLGQGIDILTVPAFSIATLAVVLYFLIGSVKYLMSGGDKEAVASARQMITHAIIGFILLMFVYFILQFIPNFLGFGPLLF